MEKLKTNNKGDQKLNRADISHLHTRSEEKKQQPATLRRQDDALAQIQDDFQDEGVWI